MLPLQKFDESQFSNLEPLDVLTGIEYHVTRLFIFEFFVYFQSASNLNNSDIE